MVVDKPYKYDLIIHKIDKNNTVSQLSDNSNILTRPKPQFTQAICTPTNGNKPHKTLWQYKGNLVELGMPTYKCIIHVDKKLIPFENFCIKAFYRSLLLNTCPPDSFKKWNIIYPREFHWQTMFKYIPSHILYRKSREVLYKIYIHTISVGEKISKWASFLCPHCQEEETIQLCFLSCISIQTIWEKLFIFLRKHTSSSIFSHLSKHEQLFGC